MKDCFCMYLALPFGFNTQADTVQYNAIQYNTTVLPSVNTNALGMFCGVKCTQHSKAATQRRSIRVRTGRNKQNMAGLRWKEKRKRKQKGGGGCGGGGGGLSES